MKIAICSDLHQEFQDLPDSFFANPEGAEILLICGDFAEISNYWKFNNNLFRLEELFEHIFVIPGNHEGYKASIEKVQNEYFDYNDFFERVTFGNQLNFVRNGVRFLGTTLWTNFDNLNQDVMETAAYRMNDYRIVEYADRILRPTDTVRFFLNDYMFLEDSIAMSTEEKVFIFTHHAPSPQSLIGRYVSNDLKWAYASDLEGFITDNSRIHTWVHGHIHDAVDYTVGNTRVVSNPRGYPSYTDKYDNYSMKVIEV